MRLRVNLVVSLLVVSSFIAVNSQLHQHVSGKRKTNRFVSATKMPIKMAEENHDFTTSVMKFLTTVEPQSQLNSTSVNSKFLDFPSALELLRPDETRDGPIKKKVKKKKWNKALMALLLAYKLKFAALIPTIIGGLILLLSTTAMAGFFFALFAAILGLKGS